MTKQSLDGYLAERGLSQPISDYLLDKLKIPHGLSHRQLKNFEKDAERAALEYSEKRIKTKAEYHERVQAGLIEPPTRAEALIATANGHPDNESTLAARRVCEKRGIKWALKDTKEGDNQ